MTLGSTEEIPITASALHDNSHEDVIHRDSSPITPRICCSVAVPPDQYQVKKKNTVRVDSITPADENLFQKGKWTKHLFNVAKILYVCE